MLSGINKKGVPAMSQELEIEFKNMLTASEYDLLMNEFRLEEADFFHANELLF